MDKPGRYVKARGGKAARSAARTEVYAEEAVRQGRERLIRERQSEVNEVLDNHDSLVRELFHLERFVSVLSYNPQEAKKDKSEVFLNFRASYDLVDHTAAAGPSRTTRRAHTERLQSLNANSATASTTASFRRGKGVTNRETDNETLWALLAAAKSKGKAPVIPESISAPVGRRGKLKSADSKAPVAAGTNKESAEGSASIAVRRRRATMVSPSELPASKKRKLNGETNGSSVSAAGLKPSTSRRQRRNILSKEHTEEGDTSLSTANGPLRRVKLIVRRPLPVYSNPRQKPPVPRFGSSLETYLKSYKAPNDQNLDDSALKQAIQQDLAIWRQVDDMRRCGRMLHRPPNSQSPSGSGAKGPQRVPDHWDQIIQEVKEHAKARRVTGKHVAAQVAGRVKGYWEAQALRDDKARAQEEKRLRTLAKGTIRLVTAKWKEAVYYIRDQERKKREAEERRRGHEHLDAILDQSGHILEAQQVDLTKADGVASRSSSTGLSATLQQWASASPSEIEDGNEESDTSTEDERQDDSDDEDELDNDSRQLLAGHDTLAADDEHDARRASSEGLPMFFPQSRSNAASSTSSRGYDVSCAQEYNEPRATYSSFTAHRSSSLSRLGSISNLENDDAGPFSTKLEWDEEPSVVSPVLQAIDFPSSTSSRSSVVPESIPELQHDHLDEPFEAADDIPPDTPTSTAFDAVSLQNIPEKEEVETTTLPQPDTIPTIEHTRSVIPSTANGAVNEADEDPDSHDEIEDDSTIPTYLRPYAVAPVTWDSASKVKPPLLLRGTLRPYQQAGLEWLASLHTNHLNGILADEMGLGKTIQTISLLAHLACDRGIWGPHLIIVPTSVLLNWEMEFKKFLPGFKVLSYHGNTKRRKELRQGWNNKYHFNVCITSYTLASRDANIFKRKAWYYMVLDEAHMIKNFKSQRWNILLMFRSFRRLLLTGTPLQNNLTELWALLQFLMSGTNFANLKEFGEWFSNPLEKAIEMGAVLDNENLQRVAKLHTVLRPYLLRRLKRDVEKELPSKFEHLVMCPLSKRQRYLYDEFMARADTRNDLQSGVYQKIANILMQLRKVVNHPDLFEVRPITTSFAMSRSAVADFEVKDLLIRRELLRTSSEDQVNFDFLGLHFGGDMNTSIVAASERSRLDSTSKMPLIVELPEAPPKDTRTIDGYRRYKSYMRQVESAARWRQIAYVNFHRCNRLPVLCSEVIAATRVSRTTITPLSNLDDRNCYLDTVDRVHAAVKSYADRMEDMSGIVDRFAFVTPVVVARDMPAIALAGYERTIQQYAYDSRFDEILHPISVKLQIAFPDPSLLQYDCGKLQELARLLRERKAGGHRILIFTQMTRVLDILETFLNYHGYLYMRLDGATKIEDRQYITERFNTDSRIFCFISSSRSGGVGINLTGADTVIFYDSDFNPQMDRQCEDRAHRIGQIRDVHIYRFISQHTIEEALLRKANQKRSLDDIVIQKGEFDWRTLFRDESALTKALGEVEDTEDAHAAAVAAREAIDIEGADAADFAWEGNAPRPEARDNVTGAEIKELAVEETMTMEPAQEEDEPAADADGEVEDEEDEEGGTTEDYMIAFVRSDMEFFGEWRLPGFKE